MILCSIDFSEHSKDLLKWSAVFAHRLGCRLIILYTYRLTRHVETDAVGWKRKIEQEAADKFSAFERECLNGSGVEYVFKAEVGFTVNRVEEFIRKNDIRFLIINKNMLADHDACEELIKRITVPTVVLP